MPLERPESGKASLGLRAIGRSPRTAALVAFRGELRTRCPARLRDYLEAWGEGAFSKSQEDA